MAVLVMTVLVLLSTADESIGDTLILLSTVDIGIDDTLIQ